MMLLRTPTPNPPLDQSAGFRAHRKRKADAPPENNERLSKRLSLLNLEQNGPKLYVPVENPGISSSGSSTSYTSPPRNVPHHPHLPSDSELMQIDDTKHKVYIYNLDDELSSESEGEGGDKERVIFLPDIEKHLRSNRIPAQALVDPRQMDKQLVLYSVPSSITVPEERDSVRKAIIEARARLRKRQEGGKTPREDEPVMVGVALPGVPTTPFPRQESTSFPQQEYDPDAMEID